MFQKAPPTPSAKMVLAVKWSPVPPSVELLFTLVSSWICTSLHPVRWTSLPSRIKFDQMPQLLKLRKGEFQPLGAEAGATGSPAAPGSDRGKPVKPEEDLPRIGYQRDS